MRTTININDALLKELRHKASKENRTFRQTLEETLHRGLSSEASPSPIRILTAPVGVKAPYAQLSMNQLYDQLESEDMPRVAEK